MNSTNTQEPVGYVSKQAIERFQDGRHADIYPSIEELTHEFFDATPMALYAAPIAAPVGAEQAALASDFGQAETRMNTGHARQNVDHFGQASGPEVAAQAQLGKGCKRSHPHENMSPECEALTEAARVANQAAQAQPIQWPTMPISKGQSPVLFEDGYAEGWAKCLSECQKAAAKRQPERPELQEARHDSAHAETESERVRALAYWLEQQTYEPEMLSCAADTLQAYLEERSQTQPLPASLVPTAPDLEYLRGAVENTALPAFLRGQIAAAVKELDAQAQQPVSVADGLQARTDALYIALEVCSAELFAQCADQPRAMRYVEQARHALALEQCARAAAGRPAQIQLQPSGNPGKLPELPDIAPTDDWDAVLDDIRRYGDACYRAGQAQPSGKLEHECDDLAHQLNQSNERNGVLRASLKECSAELFAQCGDQKRAMQYVERARAALAQQDAAKAIHSAIREGVEAAFERRAGWETKIAAAVRHLPDDDAMTVADYVEMLADSHRLTAELGRLLMGDNAPAQPSLCDLVSFVKSEGVVLAGKRDANKVDAERWRHFMHLLDAMGDDDDPDAPGFPTRLHAAFQEGSAATIAAIDAARKEQP